MPINNVPTFFPRRLSQYCAGMRYASDVNMSGGNARVSFGAPAAAGTNKLLDAVSAAAGATVTYDNLGLTEVGAPFGRAVQIVLSGACTGNVDVYGWDYLGQYMIERIALNGNTTVQGKKAFKTFDKVVYPTVGAVTLTVSEGTAFGLPYKAIKCLSEEADDAIVSTLGTLATPVLTSPATITTGDPRGTYIPNMTPDASKVLTATFIFDNTVNSSYVGGLHGVPHYGG